MCFSPTASFLAAGLTAVIGGITLHRTNAARDLPLAAMPMIFAVQQGTEGLLWLVLPGSRYEAAAPALAFLFLFFAYVFWPVYVSVAILLAEPDKTRRRLMLFCVAVGAGLAAHLLLWLLTHRAGASIESDRIVYDTGYHASVPVGLAYMIATGLPFVLSSHRWVFRLGMVTALGSVVAFAFYWEAFVSVWCFFAAAASAVILWHFEAAHRWRLNLAPI